MSRFCASAHSGAAWVVAREPGAGEPASPGAGVWENAGFAFPCSPASSALLFGWQ